MIIVDRIGTKYDIGECDQVVVHQYAGTQIVSVFHGTIKYGNYCGQWAVRNNGSYTHVFRRAITEVVCDKMPIVINVNYNLIADL